MESSQRPSRVALVGLVLVLIGGSLLWIYAGLNQPELRHHRAVSYSTRTAAGVGAAFLLWLFLRLWSKRHSASIPPELRVGVKCFPELRPYAPDELLSKVSSECDQYADITIEGARHLALDLVDPAAQRHRVIENVEIKTQQSIHAIDIAWKPKSSISGGGGRLLPIMRPRKEDVPREVVIEGGRRLAAFETAGLLVNICTRLAHLPVDSENPDTIEFRKATLSVITGFAGAKEANGGTASFHIDRAMDLARLASSVDRIRANRIWRSRDETDEDEILLRGLLGLLERRRPYLAFYEAEKKIGPITNTRFTYRADLRWIVALPAYDGWRQRKDRLRIFLHFAPRLAILSLERARSSHSYQLYVSCDDHLFVDEANVAAGAPDSRHWVRPLPRQGEYQSYIGWEEPRGKAFVSLGAVNLADSSLRNPDFVLRLTEKPPGTLAPAASVAFATLVAVWLVGVLQNSTQGVDMVAFILALPAVASTALGLFSTNANHGLRSLTAVASVTVSLLLSLLSIILYLRGQNPDVLQWALAPHHLFFFLSSWVWIALFSMAALNFIVTAGTLAMRVSRYTELVRPKAEVRITRGGNSA